MKNLKKVLALVLAVVMIMSVVTVASAKTYTDVKGTDNYADAIDALSSLKILDGFKDGDNYSFKAEDPFTRAQAAKIVAIVHNAATNGKIQDQDAISALYSNAQNNKFVDCNNSWALPFINYCRITGLADGMTATTYEPNRYVTGVQFLKLMLTTLNFDTNKEGYTGTGWDVNVLNRANEIGLTDGLADGWKAIAPITRGEAAQVLYNALTKYLVEYGQLIKGFNPTTAAVYNAAFVSNEQVAKSGFTLGGKMGITITAAHDVFMRPGYEWSYGSWTAFYLNNAVKTYTSKVSACDILVDLGVAKTSKTAVNYVVFRNGRFLHTDGTISHVANACEAAGTTFGGNGTLTQVYKVVANKTAYYVITEIDTFLSKVTGVDTTKHGKPTGNSTAIELYANNGRKYTNNTLTATVKGLTDYAKGDYVLFNVSVNPNKGWYEGKGVYAELHTDNTKIYNNLTKDVYTGIGLDNKEGSVPVSPQDQLTSLYFVDVQKAETLAGAKYTGRSLPDMDELTVNATKYNTNCTYTLDAPHAIPATPLKAATLDFFVDQYGNLIGDVTAASTATYGVLDGIYWTTAGKVYSDAQSAVAGLVKAGENAVTDITATSVTDWDGTTSALIGVTDNNQTDTDVSNMGVGQVGKGTVSTVKANNSRYTDAQRKYGVVKYTVDANGNYALDYRPGFVLATKSVDNTNPNLGQGYIADEYTIFTVKTLDANGVAVYTSYTGIKDVPTIREATAVVAVRETGDTYCKFVYVDASNAIFAGSTAIAYVAEDYRAGYEDTTTKWTYYNVYVNGVKTTVEVDRVLAGQGPEYNMFNGVGLYKLYFNSSSKLIKAEELTAGEDYTVAHIVDTSDIVVTTNAAENWTVNHTGAKIYVVTYRATYDAAGVVTGKNFVGVAEGTKDDLATGAEIWYKLVDGSTWMAETIYVFVEE